MKFEIANMVWNKTKNLLKIALPVGILRNNETNAGRIKRGLCVEKTKYYNHVNICSKKKKSMRSNSKEDANIGVGKVGLVKKNLYGVHDYISTIQLLFASRKWVP